jgi:hypothetical protein
MVAINPGTQTANATLISAQYQIRSNQEGLQIDIIDGLEYASINHTIPLQILQRLSTGIALVFILSN